jgi:glycosyltransferase involved in cell wall biosynthesis
MLISIVTPSLNQGPWIGDTLRSVWEAARGLDVEHWVMDGGSTDDTRKILEGQDFARWVSEPDDGQTDAINRGLARCSGEIQTYLCADDLLEPEALTRVVEAFTKHPEVDVVYGDGYFLESDSGWKRRKKAGPYSWDRLRAGNFLIQPAVFWRRRVFEKFGPFDASLRYCMDHEYWLRIGAGTRWLYLAEPLATCRLHADAKTSRALAAAWKEAAAMQARYGLYGKPRWDALWMAVAGQHYYRLKRAIFARVGRLRKP